MRYAVSIAGILFLALSSAPLMAAEQIPAECTIVQRHISLGADFVAGVDVDGNQVAPADLGGKQLLSAPNPIIVPLGIDLAERIGSGIKGLEMDATTGFLEVFMDGRVLYNGQDVAGELDVLCGNDAESGRFSDDGQAGPDVIKYGSPDDASAILKD
ncbi:MAG: hypothetical protein WC989_02415 [Micavibrio sp.]